MPHLKDETHEQQSLLAKYTRDGIEPEMIGVTEGRLHHYRRLVFNVIRESLSSTYLLTVNLLTQKEWSVVCQEFFESHDCVHPQVWRMPEELIAYIAEHRQDLHERYPQLEDLLQLEWLEAEYYMMKDRNFPEGSSKDPIAAPWNLNPESEIASFAYPVHIKNARFISPTDKGNYYCLIFRQRTSGKVKFMNLSPFLAWLIATLKADESISPQELFPVIAKEFGVEDEALLTEQLGNFFDKLRSDEMVK